VLSDFSKYQSKGDKFGLVVESSNADFFKAAHCELYTVGHLETRHYGFAFAKGSNFFPYKI